MTEKEYPIQTTRWILSICTYMVLVMSTLYALASLALALFNPQAFSWEEMAVYYGALVLIFAIISFFISLNIILSKKRFHYSFEETEIVVTQRKGQEYRMPYSEVGSVHVWQGLLHKVFGLKILIIDSTPHPYASEGASFWRGVELLGYIPYEGGRRIQFAGLKNKDAEALRSFLLEKIGKEKPPLA